MSLFQFGFKKKTKDDTPTVTPPKPKALPIDDEEDDLLVMAVERAEHNLIESKRKPTGVRVSGPKAKKVKTAAVKPRKKTLVKPKGRKRAASDSSSSASSEEEGSSYEDAAKDDEDDDEEEEEEMELASEDEEVVAKSSKKKKKEVKAVSKKPMVVTTPVSGKTKSFTSKSSFSSPVVSGGTSSPTSVKVGVLPRGDHEHNHLTWLNEDRRDAKKRKPDDPDFDHTSLLVPRGYLDGNNASMHSPHMTPRKITPAMRVWWEFKQQLMDTVMFFKVGKFYEMYHMDADVGVEFCGMQYMKGDTAHCGFPEQAYGKFSEVLVSRGFRVARVEQTESVEAMQERTGKKSGMVRREICGVLSRGSRTLGIRDGNEGVVEDTKVKSLFIFHVPADEGSNIKVGLCLLDPTLGKILLGSFVDRANRANLRMLLLREDIGEIGYCPTNVDEQTMRMISAIRPERTGVLGTCVHTPIVGAMQTADGEKAAMFKSLNEPIIAEKLVRVSKDDDVVLAAFGLCLRFMNRAMIAKQILTMEDFAQYVLPGTTIGDSSMMEIDDGQDKQQIDRLANVEMVMDGQALSNIEVFSSSVMDISSQSTGKNENESGSLIHFLDKTVTKGGARLLREWVKGPLQSAKQIRDRQNKVTALVKLWGTSDILQNARKSLKGMADLERMLLRIHSIGLKDDAHPDSRAIVYEGDRYNKTKIQTLVKTLECMSKIQSVLSKLHDEIDEHQDAKELQCLKQYCIGKNQGHCPDLSKTLVQFSNMFDANKAQRTGTIIPKPGTIPSYDQAIQDLDDIHAQFNQELEAARKKLGHPVKFWEGGRAKERYQIEVEDKVLGGKSAPSGWTLKTKKKGVRRFHTPGIVDLMSKLAVAEQEKERQCDDATRLVFERFDQHRNLWAKATECANELDCLTSLAMISGNSTEETPMCLPEIVDPDSSDEPPVLQMTKSRHPCVAKMLEETGKTFIPNTLSIGGSDDACCMFLTGPNMGGKSTLLRQACVAVIMAQIGCYVPAESCRLTPVDRVFTRLGATDRIMSGQSTFFVELDETATILHNATKRSLVILDELGRGTSTFDGTAIAYAVVEKLVSDDLRCRTMFATHYHALVQEYKDSKFVKTAHMTCFVNNDDEEDEDGGEGKDKDKDKTGNSTSSHDVTFLYKLASGICDKSHGLNVARLAQLPESIIQRAHEESERFEKNFLMEQLYSETRDAIRKGASQQVLLDLQKRAKQIVG